MGRNGRSSAGADRAVKQPRRDGRQGGIGVLPPGAGSAFPAAKSL